MTARAWVRAVPASYSEATCGVLSADPLPIEIERARDQHAQVVAGLRWLGFEVLWIPPADALPDSVFVEDPAVICGDLALIARSAHPVRGREAPSVRDALEAGGLRIAQMEAGTLDGGDVLAVGGRLYVSPSSRTDAEGIEALRRTFPERELRVVPLPEGVLHLKCACSSPAPGVVLLAEGVFDGDLFAGLRRVEVPREELYAANTVGRGGRVLAAAGFPGTEAALREAGLEVRTLDLSEIRKGDGSLTCLSLRHDPAAEVG